MLEDYRSELEVILLTLRTRCSGVPREAASCLIQFVTDLFLSTFRDHQSLQARVERILASKSSALPEPSLSPECRVLQLEEILAAPLVVPGVTTTLTASRGDVQSQ